MIGIVGCQLRRSLALGCSPGLTLPRAFDVRRRPGPLGEAWAISIASWWGLVRRGRYWRAGWRQAAGGCCCWRRARTSGRLRRPEEMRQAYSLALTDTGR